MTASKYWTSNELTLLRFLTGKVAMLRLLDARLIWRSFSNQQQLSFNSAIRRLHAADLIEQFQINLHPPLRPNSPLLCVSADDSHEIDCETAARCAQQRWSKPHCPTHVLVSSRLAANLFGSTAAGLPSFWNWNHDALLGEVLAHYQIAQPKLVEHWVGEHLLPKAGYRIKDPDAFLVSDHARYRIVESGGKYSVKQIQSLVDYAMERELELEIW